MYEALEDISNRLKIFNEACLNEKNYIIDWLLSGDMVWHRTERGLDSVNSNFPCYLCRLKKHEFHKINKDIHDKLRSIDESKNFLESKTKNKEGYRNRAIFNFIPFTKCIIDTLHESNGIPTNILNLIVRELIKIDNKKVKSVEKFFDWLTSIGIKNPERKNNDNSIVLKSLNG